MEREAILGFMKDLARDPSAYLAEWAKKHDTRLIGCLPMYVPEELIHAAGFLPVAVMEGREPISLANSHLMTHSCGLIRGSYDSALTGALSYLDGVVNPLLCDQLRFFSDIWFATNRFRHTFFLHLPYKLDPNAADFLLRELGSFQAGLEAAAGREMSPGDIRESIRLFNRDREAMGRVYALRRKRPGLIRARDAVDMVASSMLMPREEHVEMVLELVRELERLSFPPHVNADGVRVVLAGHPCALPDAEVLNLVEEAGCVVVDDDFYFGGAAIRDVLDEEMPPVESLVGRYMRRTICPTKDEPAVFAPLGSASYRSNQAEHLINLARESQADGVIYLREIYCDPFDFEYPFLRERMDEVDLPFLPISTEHEIGTLEPVRTRVQAFVEMVRQRK